MKKFTKIICAILLVSVLLTGALVAVLADGEYDGVVADAQALLDNVVAAADLTAKRTAMGELDAYMAGHTFDTEAEDYATFYAAYQEAEKNLRIEETTALLGTAESAQDADKKAAYQALYDALAARPLTDEELTAATLLDRVNAIEVAYVTLVLGELEAEVTATTATVASYEAFYAVYEARPLTDEEVANAGLAERVAKVDKDYLLLLVTAAKADGATLDDCKAVYTEIEKHQYDEAALTDLGVSTDDMAAVEKNYITALINEADSKEEYDTLFALTADLTPEVIETNGWTQGLADAELKYIDILANEAKVAGTIDAYKALFDRIEEKGITDEELTAKELLTKVNGAEIAYAALLLDRIDVEEHGTARNGTYINFFNYTHRNLDANHADYAAYKEVYDQTYAGKVKAQEDAMAAARAELDSKNSFGDYNKAVLGNFDYDNNIGFGVTKGSASLSYSGGNAANAYHPSTTVMDEKGHTYVITTGADGNKYITFLYRTIKDNPNDTFYGAGYNMYTQTALSGIGSGNSFVLEFDIKTDSVVPQPGRYADGKEIPGGISMKIRISSSEMVSLLDISTDGTLSTGEDEIEHAVTSGGWTHCSLVLHQDTMTADIYVNYELVASRSVLSKGVEYDFSKYTFRIDSTASDGDFAIDNYQLYAGDNVRILDKFDSLTPAEYFATLANALEDETIPMVDRYDIYQNMTDMIKGDLADADWTDPALAAANEKYKAFDLDAAIAAEKDANLAQFRGLVEGFVAMGRVYGNASDRKKKADEIQQVVHYYGNNIDRTNPEYIELEKTYQKWKADAVSDINTEAFTAQMQKFASATKVTAKQKAYDGAAALYDLLDTTTKDMPTFEPFKKAYEDYTNAGELIQELICKDNSKTIVGCMDYLSKYQTEFEWEANYEDVKKYIGIVTTILSSHTEDTPNYAEDYSGIDEALEFYEKVYGYFWTKTQKEHAAKLTEYLNALKLSEDYIEKLTYVSKFEGYIALNDVDVNDEKVKAVIANYEVEYAKVLEAEKEYNAVLEANTQKFKDAVAKIQAADNYLDKKAAYDEATEYYYVMTPGNAEAEIVIYDNCLVELNKVVADSALFVAYVEQLGFAENKDEMFATLVECCRYASDAESTLDGVAEALITYNAVYTSYVESVNGITSELDMTQFIAGSARANCGMDSVVNIIFTLIPTAK